ncbi:hypothetical protein [Williamsia sterculiae]|uniref:Neocarzinostatin family protein n=1 Tax=Williamsia sterculiae TaxID=1344003 RepID=A0A1N7ERF9_9NOCA|nr:hypothetical protein [Williamsia sterculiae]SIR90650.1 hypothetical protein SAMN05445060_1602 [Williamsia sterculiae]
MSATRRRRIEVVGAGAAALSAAAIAAGPAAQATAAPITVYQIPATGLTFSGLVIPGPYFANVTAAPTATPGTVTFATPASPETCATSAGSAQITIGYTNLGTGKRGGVTVKPCDFATPAPLTATATVGRGPILITVRITGSDYKPDAGQPSLPGIGVFTAV